MKPTLAQLTMMKTATGEKFKIIESVAPQWKELGDLLDFDPEGRTLELIEANNQQEGLVACCREMFVYWLKGKGREATWVVLIELLDDIGQSELARKVKIALSGGFMSEERAQKIVDQALKSGKCVKQKNTIAVIVGIMGSGKTCLIHRLFHMNPPAQYVSTGIAEQSFRGLMHHVANVRSWKRFSQEQDILEFLAPFFPTGFADATEPQAAASLPLTATVSVLPVESSATQAMTKFVRKAEDHKEDGKETFTIEFLYMIDTGGQPEFIEIMPSLIHSADFTILVLNLEQSLDERPHIDYHDKDGKKFDRADPSILTNREVIHQFVRTSQAKRPTHTGSQCSKLTVIGTHRDKMKGGTLAAANQELKKIFRRTLENELIVRSDKEIIFPVNLKNPDEDDEDTLTLIRDKISKKFKLEGAEIPLIPLSYFMFEQDAIKCAEQKEGRVMILSFDECVEVGERLRMTREDVQAALLYFHRLNIFLYFQKVLPNVVFLAPQEPLEFVNAIVAFKYKLNSEQCNAIKANYARFLKEGIITEGMLLDENLKLHEYFVHGVYGHMDAIKLFRHIYTIAEEPLIQSQQSPTHPSTSRESEYLMMCLLRDMPKKDLKDSLPPSSKVAPLVIKFSNGCIPNGCFGNIIACLISKYNWQVSRHEDFSADCLAHNIVTLRGPNLLKATIVNYTQHLEIHLNMHGIEEGDFSDICLHTRTNIFGAIDKVFKVMKFEDIKVEPAFLCTCKSGSHIAELRIGSYSSYLVCSETHQVTSEKHQFWFLKVDPPQTTQHPASRVCPGSQVTFTIADITGAGPLTYKWRRNGEYLSQGGGMSGTTTDTLTIASVGKNDGGKYTCVVTNVAGVTTTSNVVQLTVLDPPQITQQPAPQKDVVPGSTVRFTVTATGGGDMTYKWQRDDADLNPLPEGVSGETTDTLLIDNVKKSHEGTYMCIVSNAAGPTSSKCALLAVRHNWLRIAGGILGGILLVLVLLGIGAWCGLLDSEVPHLPGSVTAPFKYDAPPSLDVLRHFRVKNGHIDIPEEIGTNYQKFGTLLLEEKSGNKVKNIKVSEHEDPLLITVEILSQWLQGKGKKPVTWQTLVTCLQDTGLHVLAGKINDSLSEHNEIKENLDHEHPEL